MGKWGNHSRDLTWEGEEINREEDEKKREMELKMFEKDTENVIL